MENKFYVYEWYRQHDNKVFYVGKGCRRRAGTRSGRNWKFKLMIKKYECNYRIVKRDLSEKDAYETEILYIKKAREENPQINCNILDGGEQQEVDYFKKKVIMCNLKGNIIKEYNSISDAAEEVEISGSSITKCCKNEVGYKSCGGYLWKYADDNSFKTYSNERTLPRPIYKIDLKGNIVKKYNSIYEAKKIEKVDKSSINKCCNNKQKLSNGFSYCYCENYNGDKIEINKSKTPKTIKASSDKETIIFKSITETNRYFNKETDCRKVIKRCCENNKPYKGYILTLLY